MSSGRNSTVSIIQHEETTNFLVRIPLIVVALLVLTMISTELDSPAVWDRACSSENYDSEFTIHKILPINFFSLEKSESKLSRFNVWMIMKV